MPIPQTEKTVQERAEELHAAGDLTAAAELLAAALAKRESSELWSDWGAVQASRGETGDAERAFRRALRMNAQYRPAAENLGVLLYARGQFREAQAYLEQALTEVAEKPANLASSRTDAARVALGNMLRQCNAFCARAGRSKSGSVIAAAKDPGITAAEAAAPRPSETTCVTPEKSHPAGSGAVVSEVAAAIAAAKSATGYDDWCLQTFRQRIPVPGVRIAASWAEDSSWGLRAYNALAQLECEYAQELLLEIATKNIPGDIVEFGIYEGWWINFLWQASETVGLRRRIYGFDSFEGLSEPHPEREQAFWKKGQYACGLEQVSKNVRLPERPRLKLVKGFFEKSLLSPEALLAEQFCYARIDCDIYQPALDCLRYLGPRLADGAIVVFDDWPHTRGFGEQQALEEWLPTVPELQFEFLFYGAIGHFYTRVHRLA
jgi:tetratricopeptide (TPR) repeat protein